MFCLPAPIHSNICERFMYFKVWWHDATLLFIWNFFSTYIQSSHSYNTFIRNAIRRGSPPSPHRWSAQWEKPPLGAEPRIGLGSALHQADTLPSEQRRTLTELRRTLLSYAAPWFIYFQGLCCCGQICGPILGIYKSLTDTWMWKLGLRPRNS